VRSRFVWILASFLAATVHCGLVLAQESPLSAKHHPWGRFRPGAWKLVRVVTETLDERGQVAGTCVTETRTSLVKIEDDGVTLEVEVGIEVAGKQFDGQPQCIKQGFHGELSGPEVHAGRAVAGEVSVEGRKMPCRTQQIESAGPNGKTVTTVYYSDAPAPYVLRRESTTTDAEGKNVVGETTLEVIAIDMPCKVLSEMKNAAYVKAVQKHAAGTVTTLATTAADVPGGVVYHTSKEMDKEGRLVRRSTLELVSYGLQAEEERPGVFGRKRPRHRKTSTYGPAL
jgi:hypothetical protein